MENKNERDLSKKELQPTDNVRTQENSGDETSIRSIGAEANTETQTKDETLEKVTQEQKEQAVAVYVREALNSNIIAFNPFEIGRLYPKAFADTKEYIKVLSGFTPEEEALIGVFLYASRHVLTNYFDSKKVFLNYVTDEDGDKWGYFINNEVSLQSWNSRVQAEYAGVIAAYDLIEKQLK